MDAVNCHVGYEHKKRIRHNDWSCQTSILEPHVPNTCVAIIDDKSKMNGQPLRISSTENINSNKRARPYRWQRCRKRMQLDYTELLAPCTSANGRETSAVETEQNISIRDIFGLSDEEWKHISLHCFDKCHYCLEGSGCIYHSFIELLKGLIRKSRSCQFSKLMDKYCTVPALEQMAMGEAQPTPKGYVLQTKILQTNCVVVQKECILPPKYSKSKDNRKQQKHCQRISRVYGQTNELSGSYCLKSHVVSFIWAVCRNIVPVQLLGSPSNWRSLRRNISKFIHLRRYEKFSLKQCMQGLKTSCIPLLSNSYSSCYLHSHTPKKTENMFKGCQNFSETIALLKNKIFSCWVYWFFSRLVVPIIHANFYVTEVEDGKRELFYYPKAIWEKLFSRGAASLREQNYSLLNQETLLRMLGKRSFGFSKVRFCPKGNGIRVLANLKAPSILPARRFKSVNGVLRDLSAVLKGLKLTDPKKLGSSVFDYNDVYEKLCPFIIGLKKGSSKMPRVYVVICDISKAFDSVNQDKLLKVMEDVMLNKEYSLESVSEVLCTKKSTWVHHEQRLSNQNVSSVIVKFATSAPSSVMHRVRINQEARRTVTKAQLYQDLQEHVKGNVLQLQKKFYLQEVGIPQGSVVSSLLCSFYYAHLEEKVIFPFLKKVQDQHTSISAQGSLFERNICQDIDETEKGNSSMSPKHLLVRLIDDFLFISTSKHMATSFFERVQRGFSGYSCSINKAKSCMNFNIAGFSGLQSKRVYTGNDGISFLPWSGLLINCCTLEIQADYTSYMHKLLKKRMYSMKTGTDVHPTLKLKKEEVVWLGLKAYIRVLKRKQPRHSQLLSLLRAEFLRSHVVETASLKYAIDDSHSSLFWKIKY
ncbi:Telomerase reverse transcriptase [Thalictrum thalictroides]|uniref:Telomerase reverse transcriptase n=1 Tax=Thalictrum thalictroides TaxID=46969 RepID=A0A7J6UYM4_THATH|nr:Telomerase reverse transcriptase [Thalictrum thalictroides]